MPHEAATANVARDMERIFAPLAGRPMPRPAPAALRRGPRRRGLIAATALGALVAGTAISFGLGFGEVPPVRAPDRPVAAAAPKADPAPAMSVASPVTADAYPSAAAPPLPVVPRAAPSTEAPAPTFVPPGERRRAAIARTKPRRLAVDEARCTPDSDEDHCIYRDLMAADARLRRAYRRAADEGVSPSWLASINARWERAREQSRDEPDRAIERYDRLARAIDDERRGWR